MNVDDAELLALAGGESSDDETPQRPTSIAKAVSPLPSIEISQADSKNFAASSSKSQPRGGMPAMKKTRMEDSEESGEA